MAENSKIEWCDHTFNPWVGCTKVSAACDNCYAEGWAKRTGQSQLWQGERRRTSEANWQQPLKWNRQAEREGRRFRVFCASLADVFDNKVPREWRRDLWKLIRDTPALDWLLLTKRPQNIAKMLPGPSAQYSAEISRLLWLNGWPNVWLGTTVENQQEANRRIPHLLAVPAAVHFLSCEPLLGPIALDRIDASMGETCTVNALTGDRWYPGCGSISSVTLPGKGIDWIIAGGESGPGARPMHPAWARGLRDQCAAAGVPFLFKQHGDWIEHEHALNAVGDDDPRVSDGRRRLSRETGGVMEMGGTTFIRLGKKAAGRLLDGREHNEFPR
jgi:protein gp37